MFGNENRIKVLDNGYIQLLDSMGSDIDIVNAARTSFNNESYYHHNECKSVNERDGDCSCQTPDWSGSLSIRDAGLINFLMKNAHATPFEMVEFKFAVKAPIFVLREWHRHRIASINEMSGRYVELEREFYIPARDDMREQKGKAGAYYYERIEDDELAELVQSNMRITCDTAFDSYEDMLSNGIAKEVARLVLPVNTYSKMVWKTNARALMNFVSLRNHPHAQMEIRKYAEEVEKMMDQIIPIAMQSFRDNGRRAV